MHISEVQVRSDNLKDLKSTDRDNYPEIILPRELEQKLGSFRWFDKWNSWIKAGKTADSFQELLG